MGHVKKITDTTKVLSLLEMPNGGASDLVLKRNVNEVTTALKRILALRPVTWYWKDSEVDKLQYGFIAQEVEDIFPELVTVKEWDDGTLRKFLSTKDLLPYLVKAMGEQQQEIDMLQRKIKALEKQPEDSE